MERTVIWPAIESRDALMNDLEPKVKQWHKESGGIALYYVYSTVILSLHSKTHDTAADTRVLCYDFHLPVKKCQLCWPSAPSTEYKAEYPSAILQE